MIFIISLPVNPEIHYRKHGLRVVLVLAISLGKRWKIAPKLAGNLISGSWILISTKLGLIAAVFNIVGQSVATAKSDGEEYSMTQVLIWPL